jgi:hypothetical protein
MADEPAKEAANCDHEWKDIDSMSDKAVVCVKCRMAGERQPDESVYWPAT